MKPAGRDPATLESIVASYLDVDGVDSAALVSNEGLLVVSAGDSDGKLEGVAAHAASALSASLSLAHELSGEPPRLITLKMPESNLVMAPLAPDLFLMLVGGDEMLKARIRHHQL